MRSSDSIGTGRLVLGTVQFGLPYGVANTQGQVSFEQAKVMLKMARNAGIDTLDTAIAYGEAETVLGQIGLSDFRLIGKVPALPEKVSAPDDWVVAQVEASLERLQIERFYGLMLHAPNDLLGPHGSALSRGLQRARDIGLTERIGLSVYSPEQLSSLVECLPLEIIQIPLNVFDRRFFETGWLDRLVDQGIEIHARSIFLQGLLLMPSHLVPSKFSPFGLLIDSWHHWLNGEVASGRSSLEVCLAHVASYPGIARIVIGADNPSQLQDIIAAAAVLPQLAPASLSSPASPLIDPTQWNKL